MKTIFFFATLCLASVLSSPVLAQTTPAEIRDQAIEDLQSARNLVERAHRLLKISYSEINLDQALKLYLDAGRLFEKSYNVFQVLGPQFISEEDLDGIHRAMESCVEAINMIHQRMDDIRKIRLQHKAQ